MKEKKDILERRTFADAPHHYPIHQDRAWAAGYNAAIESILKLVPDDPSRDGNKALSTGSKRHPLNAHRLAAFLLTSNPKSHVVIDDGQHTVVRAELDSRKNQPLVILK